MLGNIREEGRRRFFFSNNRKRNLREENSQENAQTRKHKCIRTYINTDKNTQSNEYVRTRIHSTKCNTVLYCTVLYCTVQYSTVQYSTVQYSTVQYNIVQCCTLLMGCAYVHMRYFVCFYLCSRKYEYICVSVFVHFLDCFLPVSFFFYYWKKEICGYPLSYYFLTIPITFMIIGQLVLLTLCPVRLIRLILPFLSRYRIGLAISIELINTPFH